MKKYLPISEPGELRCPVHLSGEIKDTPKPDIHGKLKRKPKYLSTQISAIRG